jgi:hypothetical protein
MRAAGAAAVDAIACAPGCGEGARKCLSWRRDHLPRAAAAAVDVIG